MKISWVIALLWLATSQPMVAGDRIVVLPERFANSPVIVQNSPAFKALVANNAKLAQQLSEEKSAQQEFERVTDLELQARADKLEQLEIENDKLKSRSHFNFFGFINLVMSFVANPFGFVMQRIIQIVLVLVIIIGSIIAVRVILNHRRKKKS